MMLSTTRILELLGSNPGSYILHNVGNYRLKNADGSDMLVPEGDKIEPIHQMIDDLMDAKRIRRDGKIYRLAE